MQIGPLTLRPPVGPLVSQVNSLLLGAGVLGGDGAVLMPDLRLTTDARVSYRVSETGFIPLIMVNQAESAALDSYARAGGNPMGETRFVREARAVASIFSMSTRDVAHAAVENAVLMPNPSELEGILARAALLKGSTFAELISAARVTGEGNVLHLNNGLIGEAALDADLVSTLAWRRGGSAALCQSALFSMISGILLMASDTDDASDVMASFLYSANLFSEAGMYVAAAMSSEISTLVEINTDEEAPDSGSAFSRTARRWLEVALKAGRDDPAARLVAVHRGLVAALSAGDEAVGTRRSLLMMSAAINSSRGRHEEAGRDYLRILMDMVSAAGWSVYSWERVADVLEMARAAYVRADDPGGVEPRIRKLERMTRGIASHVNDEMRPLERAVGSDPEDDEARWRRAMARSRYGDFKGALADLKWLELSQEGSPYLLSEMGHVYHLLADYFMSQGRTEDVGDLLGLAIRCMSQALTQERENRLQIPILHARLGALHVTMGSLEEGIEALQRAETLQPGSREIKEYLEKVLAFADAISGSKDVIPLHPRRR